MAGMNLEGQHSPHDSCVGSLFKSPSFLLLHRSTSKLSTRLNSLFLFVAAARKTKKMNRLKGVQQSNAPKPTAPGLPVEARPLVPKCMPQLVPTMLSLLKAIEPETIYSGYDSTVPDTSTRLMTTLNRLGGRQVISAVKWAKALPGW